MRFWTLIFRSLRFHARSHFGVALGAMIGSAALVGALVVGDSVRESLREMALSRLGRVNVAMVSNDRLFRSQLAQEISSNAAALLQLPGTAFAQEAATRANHVQVLGVDAHFWALAEHPPSFTQIADDSVVLNSKLANQLKVGEGDTILLRIQKPSLLSRDALVSPQSDLSVAMRLKVQAIVSDEQFGRFGLQANQIPPFNAFVDLTALQNAVTQTNRANLLLCARENGDAVADDEKASSKTLTSANQSLAEHWQLADAELDLRDLPDAGVVELRSSRIFLDPAIVDAAREISSNSQPLLTYFVNELRSGSNAAPYSMVTAGSSAVPADMRDDEILIGQWLADDLEARAGDPITLRYFVVRNGRAMEEQEKTFRVRAVIPISGVAADRSLMPDFPGIAEAESTGDWDAGFPIDLKRIRPKDEQYWKQYRGTPKAFVTYAAGTQTWSNRFGDSTAVRFPSSAGNLEAIRAALLKKIRPATVGLAFQPVRQQALVASSQAVDFGGLFIGFSFFLIVAALLLMALLFQFGLERRATEIGTLLAVGWHPRQVRRLFLGEGAVLAVIGGIVGAAAGIGYAKAMLFGLATIWRSAVGASALHYHALPQTLVMGAASGVIVAMLTIWLALRRQAKRPARELLVDGAAENMSAKSRGWKRNWGAWVGVVSALCAIGMIGAALAEHDTSSAETFFCAGALILIAGLGFASSVLNAIGSPKSGGGGGDANFTLSELGIRACGRRRKRSLATIGLLACGIFLTLAISVFRIDANQDALNRASGTGGFALIGESSLPVTYDLNSQAGRNFYGLNSPVMSNMDVVQFRVHDGDEASCLNLNHAQTPRLLGVNSTALAAKASFTFAETMKGISVSNAWLSLIRTNNAGLNLAEDEIPAIGDENSILWAMNKKIGDTVDYVDEHGRKFKLKLVAAVANSVLQGNLIVDENEFVKRYPGESGYRMFLVDAPDANAKEVSAQMTRMLQDNGLELMPAAQRLNEFNAVQNTYLSTFQVLGGLGLLLGSAGLGVVVLRNVQERRGELGLLLALGFRRGALHRLVLSEHAALLALGLCVGGMAAGLAVLPSLLAPSAHVPVASIVTTCGAVLLNGLIWTWLATSFALRGRLLDALRNE